MLLIHLVLDDSLIYRYIIEKVCLCMVYVVCIALYLHLASPENKLSQDFDTIWKIFTLPFIST